MVRKQLDILSKVQLKEVIASQLPAVDEINLPVGKTMHDRTSAYLEQISNPYMLQCNGIPIKIEFIEDGSSFEELLFRYFEQHNGSKGGGDFGQTF